MRSDSPSPTNPPRRTAPLLRASAYTAPHGDACVACGHPLSASYCSACGERRASERRHTLREFATDNIEALTSFDGRAIRTYRLLLTRPGELTLEFIRGVRLRYLPPLQCFLIINVLFFLWSTAVHTRVLDADLQLHLRNGIYGRTAARLIAEKIVAQHGDSALVVHEFATVTGAQAKSLVLVMVPLFAICVGALTVGRTPKRYAVHDLVFSLHFYSYVLVLLAGVLSVLIVLVKALPPPLGATLNGQTNTILSVSLSLGTAVYLALGLRRVYGLGRVRAGATAAAATFLVGMVFATYRALLFFITIAAM
jgi:hypothetical protein